MSHTGHNEYITGPVLSLSLLLPLSLWVDSPGLGGPAAGVNVSRGGLE